MLFVIDSKNPSAEELFSPHGEVRMVPTAEITSKAIRDADVVIVRTETTVNREFLEGSRVQFVGTATIGTDHVDTEYLQREGIGFASAPGSNANSVAEYIVSALLTLSIRSGTSLRGRSIGIVGAGNVGSRVAQKAEILGLRVLKNDPPLKRSTGDPELVSLDELVGTDILSFHVPLTRTGDDATWHLCDHELLSRLHPGTILINTSRGAVVDNSALLHVLRKGHLGGAVLDVWEGEPNIRPDLLEHASIGTPHIAGYSLDGKLNAISIMYDHICSHFRLDPQRMAGTEESQSITMADSVEPDDMDEGTLFRVVSQAYDISKDDATLRKILTVPETDRGSYFRRLRASYPVRREFRSYRIHGIAQRPRLVNTLSQLGFTVEA